MTEVEPDASAIPRRHWLERTGLVVFVAWAVLVFAFIGSEMYMDTLEAPADHLLRAVLFGAFFGTVIFVVFVLTIGFALVGLAALLRAKKKIRNSLILAPTLFIIAMTIKDTIPWRQAGSEPALLKKKTNLDWPNQARCLLAKHRPGVFVGRHLWVFEGSPEEFERHHAQLPWQPAYPEEADKVAKYVHDIHLPLAMVQKAFASAQPWIPAVVYRYASWSDDPPDDKLQISSPGYLIANAEHTQWCVWWAPTL